MKEKVAKKVQEIFRSVAVNSVGRSAPIGIYETPVSEELKENVLKIRENGGVI